MVCGLTAATWYYVTPKYTRVGYQPVQPVPFPHDVHVSQLGMDCRYCHSFVDVAAHSNLPNTQTCMNCHTQVQKDNPKLEPVRASWKTGKPISGCKFIARPITFFTITPPTSIAVSVALVATARSTRCRWFIMPNRTAWPGASNAIGTPKIFCVPTIRSSTWTGSGRRETGGVCGEAGQPTTRVKISRKDKAHSSQSARL